MGAQIQHSDYSKHSSPVKTCYIILVKGLANHYMYKIPKKTHF